MRTELILAIDQGTHATRAILFDRKGGLIRQYRQPIGLSIHDHYFIEQDAAEILTSVDKVISQALRDCADLESKIVAAGLATQRSTIVAWDRKNGRPLAPAISWQDRRMDNELPRWIAHKEQIHQMTGLRLSAHAGAPKMRWWLEHSEPVKQAAAAARLAMGPLSTFLLHHLLEGNPTIVDHANAARTLLLSQDTLEWHSALVELFEIDPGWLPTCLPTQADYGVLATTDIPLKVVHGDQPASIYSQGEPWSNTAYINVGSGAFIQHFSGGVRIEHPQLLTGIANSTCRGCHYVLEGTVNGAGNALTWLEQHSDKLNRVSHRRMDHEGGAIFLNTVSGLGSPWWRGDLEPRFICGERSIDMETAEQAVLESIAFLIMDNLTAMESVEKIRLDRLVVSGGISQRSDFCDALSALAQRPVIRPQVVEATARGTAWLAGGKENWHLPSESFVPRVDHALQERYDRFKKYLSEMLL